MRKGRLLLIAGLGAAGALGYVAYQQDERQRLFVNCFSDKLHPIAGRLDEFRRRGEPLPD